MRPGAFPVICAQDLALLSALRQQFTLLDDVSRTSLMGCGKPLFNFNALQAGKCRLNQDLRRTEEQKIFGDPLSMVFLSCEGSFFLVNITHTGLNFKKKDFCFILNYLAQSYRKPSESKQSFYQSITRGESTY